MTLIPWRLPGKRAGLKAANFWMEPELLAAIQELTHEENAQHPSKISQSTIIANLVTRNGNTFTKLRARLNDKYNNRKEGNSETSSNRRPADTAAATDDNGR